MRGEMSRLPLCLEAIGTDKADRGIVVGVLIRWTHRLALTAVDAIEGAAQGVVLKDGGHAVVVEEHGDFNRGAGEFLPILTDVFIDDLERCVQQFQVLRKKFLVLVVGAEIEDQFGSTALLTSLLMSSRT